MTKLKQKYTPGTRAFCIVAYRISCFVYATPHGALAVAHMHSGRNDIASALLPLAEGSFYLIVRWI